MLSFCPAGCAVPQDCLLGLLSQVSRQSSVRAFTLTYTIRSWCWSLLVGLLGQTESEPSSVYRRAKNTSFRECDVSMLYSCCRSFSSNGVEQQQKSFAQRPFSNYMCCCSFSNFFQRSEQVVFICHCRHFDYEIWYIKHCTEELRRIRELLPRNRNKITAVRKEVSSGQAYLYLCEF